MTGRIAAERPTYDGRHPADDEGQISADMARDAIELLLSKSDGKHTIVIKVRATSAYFRIAPVRDPQQPRLWCVSVRQCSSGGLLEATGLIWIDRPGTTRTDLAGAIDAIREDIGGWLAAPARRDLCRWLLTATPVPTPAQAAGLPNPERTSRPH